MPTNTDLYFLSRPRGCLGINKYFFNRFRRLPQNTLVIENEHYFINFFLANCIVKLFRKDICFLISARQRPVTSFYASFIWILRELMAWFFFHSADLVSVNSRFLKREIVRRYKLSDHKFHVVYSAGQRLSKPLSERIKKDNKSKTIILCVSHIRRHKGQHTLLTAMQKLRSEQVELLLVGSLEKDPLYMNKILELIHSLCLTDKIRILGELKGETLAQAYVESDIFVFPSLYEPYGIVVQEAMSFQLPIIASNVGGIPEQIRNGVEGFLVPPGDPDALALALQELIDNPDLRISMGKSGLKRLNELPTWDDVCERFYQALIGLSKDR